jgi:hypothetical protein
LRQEIACFLTCDFKIADTSARDVLRARNTSTIFRFFIRSNNFRYPAVPPQNLLLRIGALSKHRYQYARDRAENSDLSACRDPTVSGRVRLKPTPGRIQLTSSFPNTMSCKLVEHNPR